MDVEDFVYTLPEELIAARPAERRDHSRLMVVPRDPGAPPLHERFHDIRRHLRPGDVLVLNDSRVVPARLYATRATGGRVEVLLLQPEPQDGRECWSALVRPAKKIQPGERLDVAGGAFHLVVQEERDGGERLVSVHGDAPTHELLRRHGHMPLPPYILRQRQQHHPAADRKSLDDALDRERYQTVYAREDGSVAAPTAGLHFTSELLDQLRADGVHIVFVTLHVGAGTFQSMPEGGRVEDFHLHAEEYEVPPATAEAINRARLDGRRVIAVGTTSVRTLEAAMSEACGSLPARRARTSLMIAPGHGFRVVDGLITNFHLPRSSLLLLVSALVGRKRLLSLYTNAIEHRYRFYSYGDAMFILPEGREPGSPTGR